MEAAVGETLFLDTNVLLHATDGLRPFHEEARRIIAGAGTSGFHLAVSGQVLREYLAVATRPANSNGLGLEAPVAVRNVERFSEFTIFLDEAESVAQHLRELVRKLRVSGKRIHDANIAATMLAHHIRFLITEDSAGFAQFGGIETLSIRQAVLLLRA